MPERFLARLARGAGYVLTGNAPAAWFGPQHPLPPQAPPEVAGRQFDYPFGFNLAATPRSWEPTGFAELRALADAFDLMRLVIETRKDQMERQTWRIRPRSLAANSDVADADPRVAALTAFFRCPDRQHGWATWLRMLLEDLLVIDAPTLYKRRTRGGALWALELLDGATVKRLIDDWGRTPAPPMPAYQQILKGMPAVDYTADELIYAPRNPRVHKAYGFSPVEQVQMSVNIALRRQIYQLQYYTEGNIPEALIGVPETWNPDQIRQFQAYWDSLNSGDTAERRHAKFVPGGVAKTFVPVREPALKDAFDEWLARVVCYAFSVPPSAFVPQVNRATAENAQDVALAEGLAPLLHWVKHLIDRVIAEEFGASDLEFAWDQDRDADPSATATIAADYVKTGIKSINEVRAELGLPPVAGGEQPKIQTAHGLMPLTGAGAAPNSSDKLQRFNPNHYGPGPNGGQFAPSGDGGSGDDTAPRQVAQEENKDRDDRDSDSNAPLRAALYSAARSKLSAIDPSNAVLTPFVTAPGWSPSGIDVNNMQDALDRAIENHAEAAASYAYDKHVDAQAEFPEIGSQVELQLLAQQVISTSPAVPVARGRVIFYQSSSNTLVIVNLRYPSEDNIFRPEDRQAYVNQLVRQK
ncbi:MAG TPA: phage portal protein [Stellaceae bacterium]|nr:phage portal protein [Stellaceae bacterium]